MSQWESEGIDLPSLNLTDLIHAAPIDQDALAGRLEPAAHQALEHPEENDLTQAGGQAAQCRGDDEDRDRHQEIVAPAQVGRKPAGDGQDCGVGGQIAGEDPFAVYVRR